MSRLIVNADDFGLTAGVNRAVIQLHRAGVVTSATLMARAAASIEAIDIARATPALGLGCHVVLVDGDPVSPPRAIPTLIDQRTGRFHPTLGSFLGRLLAGHIRRDEIETEAAAQIELLQSNGLVLTHVDTHKHTHMFPAVLKPILRAAAGGGIRSIRNPFEPAWSVHVTSNAPRLRRAQIRLLRRLLPAFHNHVVNKGFATTDGTIGILATGTLDSAAVSSLLRNSPLGTWELVTHPGYNDADLAQTGTRLLATRELEWEGLMRVKCFPEIELINFGDLQVDASRKTIR